MINILLAEDTQILMDGVKSIIAKKPEEFNLVAEAVNGEVAIELLKTTKIDVAILDIEMPKVTGLQLTEHIKKEHPEIKVLILSMYKKLQYINAAIDKGADGYILKDSTKKEELFEAIREVMDGGVHFDKEVMKLHVRGKQEKKNTERANLTPREKEILKLIVDGLKSQEMAVELHVAISTIETHRRNLMGKLDVKNVSSLVRKAIEEGYLDE